MLKDLEIQFVKDKIFQISDKLNTIKDLNSHFNKNIETINAQIEVANRRFYEAKIKAEHNLLIKDKIMEALNEYCDNEKFCYKKNQKIEKFAKFFEIKQENSGILEEIKENIENSLKIIPNYQKEESALELEKNINSLSFPSHKLDEKLKKDKISNNPIEIQ